MYTLEEKQVGRFTVEVFADWDFDWDFALGDEPVLVFAKTRGRFDVLFDESKQVPQSFDVLASVEDADWVEAIWHADGLADVETLEDGRVRVVSEYFQRPRYFKTLESAAKRTVGESIGLDLEDVKVERFSTRDAEVYVAWSQKELDQYTGTKDASAPLKTVRYFLDGDVYGFRVRDADGDVLESCWGFIGDSSYCMSEAEAEARGLEDVAQAEDAKTLEASRPDLYIMA
jgi:hypothetical protein